MNDLKINNIYGNVKSISRKVFSISQEGIDELANLVDYEQLIKYSADGFKVYEEMVSNHNKSFSIFKYDDLCRLIELEHCTQGGRYGGKVKYSYDKKKNEKKDFDISGRLKKSTIEILNEYRLPIEKRVNDEQGNLIELEKFVYDEKGNLLNHEKEILKQSTVITTCHRYDEQGNKIFSKNANGTIEYRYNAKWLLCKVINNTNLEENRFISVKEYDAYNHIVSRSIIKESQSDTIVKYNLTLDDKSNIINSETIKDDKVVKVIQQHIEYY